MAQYLENALKYDRVPRWKSGLERLRMFFDAAPSVHSEKKANELDCEEKTMPWEEAMKEKLKGWWW